MTDVECLKSMWKTSHNSWKISRKVVCHRVVLTHSSLVFITTHHHSLRDHVEEEFGFNFGM